MPVRVAVSAVASDATGASGPIGVSARTVPNARIVPNVRNVASVRADQTARNGKIGRKRRDRPERPDRGERPRGEGGAQEGGEGRGRRRRGRRERGGRGEGEAARTEGQDVRPEFAVAAVAGSIAVESNIETARFEAPFAEPESVASAVHTRDEATALEATESAPVITEPPTREPGAIKHVPPAPAAEPLKEASPGREPEAAAPRYMPPSEVEQTAQVRQQPEPAAYRAPALAQVYAIPQDLVQVETSNAPAPSELPAADEQPRRPRRPRSSEAAPESEPLVQIETRSATSSTD